MSKIIFLVNEYQGVLDLSSITDVQGKRVMLQPKGLKGSERECFEEVETHPSVITFKKANRLSVRRDSAAPAEPVMTPPAPAPAPAPAAVTTPLPAPEPEPLPPAPEPTPEPAAVVPDVVVTDAASVQSTSAGEEPLSTPTSKASRRR